MALPTRLPLPATSVMDATTMSVATPMTTAAFCAFLLVYICNIRWRFRRDWHSDLLANSHIIEFSSTCTTPVKSVRLKRSGDFAPLCTVCDERTHGTMLLPARPARSKNYDDDDESK